MLEICLYTLVVAWGVTVACRRHVGWQRRWIIFLVVVFPLGGQLCAYLVTPNNPAWINDYHRAVARAAWSNARLPRDTHIHIHNENRQG